MENLSPEEIAELERLNNQDGFLQGTSNLEEICAELEITVDYFIHEFLI
tara:strand:+ start:115 stop:261 length:147 start_codon:yes stop_codon:yes gene_type:complete